MSAQGRAGDGRLLLVEAEGASYALPISGVVEIVEHGPVACVPTLPAHCAGVVNWHGSALPVVARGLLLGEERLPAGRDGTPGGAGGEARIAADLLAVICARPGGPAQLGIPVDRVLGLLEAAPEPGDDGPVVSILDPARLVARAADVIASASS